MITTYKDNLNKPQFANRKNLSMGFHYHNYLHTSNLQIAYSEVLLFPHLEYEAGLVYFIFNNLIIYLLNMVAK